MNNYNRIFFPFFLIGILITSSFIVINPLTLNAQENLSSPSSDTNASSTIDISLNSSISDIEKRMVDISTSDKPEDIATLAYVWGYPLINMERSFNYFTSPGTIAKGISFSSPVNYISFSRELINASSKDAVSPNADTLYGYAWLDLTKEPVIIKVPPIESDRYSLFQFMDAYTNDYAYLGTRASSPEGGTFWIAGPSWNGTAPSGMTKIWSPTNLVYIFNRILIKGPSDASNVHAIQDQIKVMPLSVYLNNSTTTSTDTSSVKTAPTTTMTNASSLSPINPAPRFIPTTGIKIYDEIGAAMIGNPLNPPDPGLVKKIASIGIGPGMVPSTQANDTIKSALQTGITVGEKLIDAKVANIGDVVNGWSVNPAIGVFGTDYLFRAAIAKFQLAANIGQEAVYPSTFVDSSGKTLTGNNNYTIHFDPGQTPPVDAFWSISMYNNVSNFVDNPIDRYLIGQYTEGLKNNTDGSLDIYLQNQNPGPDKESNWLPAPSAQDSSSFNLNLRTYLPKESLLNGTWSPPPVIRSGQ